MPRELLPDLAWEAYTVPLCSGPRLPAKGAAETPRARWDLLRKDSKGVMLGAKTGGPKIVRAVLSFWGFPSLPGLSQNRLLLAFFLPS